jgi:LAS superfamily LD-carboxypeptidase LdcB
MTRRTALLCAWLGLTLIGCAAHRPNEPIDHSSPAEKVPFPTPPFLTDRQILGLDHPPGLVQDPSTGQKAQAAVMEYFWKLKEKAHRDGWNLILVSGFRSFYKQRQIWNDYDHLYKKSDGLDEKGRVRAVMTLVSVPGLSRHQWGTELDISEASLRGQLENVNPGTPVRVVNFYRWMEQNAPAYGFCKIYLGKKGAVRDEPWHWSFVPFAKVYESRLRSLGDYHLILNDHVADVGYLMRNFPHVLEQEMRSINDDCDSDPSTGSGTTPEGPSDEARSTSAGPSRP